MDRVFHPWSAEARLVAWRSLPRLARAAALRLLLSAGILALAAWVLRELDQSPSWLAGRILDALSRWDMMLAATAAALEYAVVQRTVADLRAYLEQGWWVAVPVSRRATVLTFAGVAGLRIALNAVAIVAVLSALGWIARSDAAAALSALMSLGLGLGGGMGLIAAMVRTPRYRRNRRARSVAPLWRVQVLDRLPLGTLTGWQRREATLQWRKGGKFWMMGLVMAGIPIGAPIVPIFGFVMLAAAMVWFSTSLQASVEVTARARHLLAAVPLGPGTLPRALARYPVLGAAIALAACLLGTLLLGAMWVGWLSAFAILAILSIRTIVVSLALVFEGGKACTVRSN